MTQRSNDNKKDCIVNNSHEKASCLKDLGVAFFSVPEEDKGLNKIGPNVVSLAAIEFPFNRLGGNCYEEYPAIEVKNNFSASSIFCTSEGRIEEVRIWVIVDHSC